MLLQDNIKMDLKYYVMLCSIYAIRGHSNQKSNFMNFMKFLEEM